MQEDPVPRSTRKKSKPILAKTVNLRWIFRITAATIGISIAFSLISDSILDGGGMLAAFALLLAIILIGILFDIVGVSVTAADEKPFHSMAARKVPGAVEALRLVRHAEKVSTFCNDVVGDICGIISGTAAAVITAQMIVNFTPTWSTVTTLLMAGLVSGLTVGGKAVGKGFAMQESTEIVFFAARVIHYVKNFPAELSRMLHKKKQ